MVHSVSQLYPALLALAGDRGTAAGLVLVPPARRASARVAAGAVPDLRASTISWSGAGSPRSALVLVPGARALAGWRAPICSWCWACCTPRGASRWSSPRQAAWRGPVAAVLGVHRGVPVAVRRRRAHAARARRHLARFPASARDAVHRRVRSMIEVILREDVKSLGKAGEMVRVKPGYARNYLLPQGLAFEATEGQQEAHRRGDPRPRRPEPGGARRGRARRPPTLSAVYGDADGQGRRGRQAVRLDHRPGHRRGAGRPRATRSTGGASSWSTRSRRSVSTPSGSGCIPRSTPRSASRSSRSSPTPMTVGIAYVDGPRLARSLFAAADWVAAGPGGDQPDQRLPGPRRRYRHQLQPDPSRRRRRPPGARRRAASGHRPHHGPRRRARRPGQLRHDARPLPAGLRRVAGRPADAATHPGRAPRRSGRAPTGSTNRSTTPAKAPSSPSRARPPRPRSARPPRPTTSASSCAGCSRRARRPWPGPRS